MPLYISLITDKMPEAFAVFELLLEDGSTVRVNAVLEKIEFVRVMYRHVDSRDLRVRDVDKVIYDGSPCTPNTAEGENVMVYGFNTEVADPCKIKKYAKLIIIYNDGTKEEVCGEFFGIRAYKALYKSCADIDNVKFVKLISMGFKPEHVPG
jgi:hypothetical protein